MNDFKRLQRDLHRDPALAVTKRGRHLRVQASDGRGPIVWVSSSGGGEGRTLANTLAQLRRAGLTPAGW